MRRLIVACFVLTVVTSLAWAQSADQARVIYPKKVALSKPLTELIKNFKPGTLHKQGAGDREIPNRGA